MELQNELCKSTKRSLEFFENKPLEVYQEWLEMSLRLNKQCAMSNFLHLMNFLQIHSRELGGLLFFYLEKLFYLALELRLVEQAKKIYKRLEDNFRGEPKIARMNAELAEIDLKEDLKNFEFANSTFKKLIEYNQEDRVSIKKYLAFLKSVFSLDQMKKYTELWNEYLKVYMDDFDGWYELSDVYIQTNNFRQAIYCLEEVLLHIPNNYQIYTKIGDLISSSSNSEASSTAIKYYAQSILIKPTPRAFWGIVFSVNIINKANKTLDEKTTSLLKIASISLQNLYANSPFKFTLDQFYDIKTIHKSD